MDRRKFIKRTSSLTASSIIMSSTGFPLFSERNESLRGRFGGNPKVRGKSTGFFHTENIEGRWWLVTPDGNSFLISGCNHLDRGYVAGYGVVTLIPG